MPLYEVTLNITMVIEAEHCSAAMVRATDQVGGHKKVEVTNCVKVTNKHVHGLLCDPDTCELGE